MLKPLFGSEAAESVLLFLHVYGEGHAARIAEVMDMQPNEARRQLIKFEDAGLLVSRAIGRAQVYQWKPGNPYVAPLRELLETRVSLTSTEEVEARFRMRTRPRRAGKP